MAAESLDGLRSAGPSGRNSRNLDFSDMINETPTLMMPALVVIGPQKMLEQAKANGLFVPMRGYKIHVCRASMHGMSPQAWITIKAFWALYFRDAGAELAFYSADTKMSR